MQCTSYRLSEVQEPQPQPPPRSSRGGYDVPYVIRKRYIPLLSLSGRVIARSLIRQSIQAILLEKNRCCICY